SSRLVNGPQRCAGELELPAGLERYGAARLAVRPLESNDVASLRDRLPAEAGNEPLHQGPHTALALIGHGSQRFAVEEELFVLGADAPCACGLRAGSNPGDELVARAHGWGRCAVLAGGH